TELRFFAGLTTEEASRVMDVSVRTLKREWQAGRVWLARYIHGKQTYGF
ncbi:MAG: RNA polymerase subunit sigma-70, partial [Rhodocyclales bacterium CG17_big_fil_post_rev_8_21_14_2_50_68_7]